MKKTLTLLFLACLTLAAAGETLKKFLVLWGQNGRPKIVYHTGDNGGFTIYAGKVPERDITFMFFSTRDDIDRMAIVGRVWDIIFSIDH